MEILKTVIDDIILIRPTVHADPRGDFRETYHESIYKDAGITCDFVQDNFVHSVKNVFRGLHFQLPPVGQAKLITILEGEILDIALDLRKGSDTYLKVADIRMSADKHDQLFIPAGFAHGYYVLSDKASISYKVSAPYSPEHQAGVRWDDDRLDLKQLITDPILSNQDRHLPTLVEILAMYEF